MRQQAHESLAFADVYVIICLGAWMQPYGLHEHGWALDHAYEAIPASRKLAERSS